MDATKKRDEAKSAGALRQPLVVTIVVGILLLIFGPWAYHRDGDAGILAATIAAVACLVGTASTALVSVWFNKPEHALFEVLVGWTLRMTVPLALCMTVMLRGGRLAEAGFPYYVLIFYLATLAVSTVMSLPDTRQAN